MDLEIGPGGDLFYVDLSGKTIHRIKYVGANNPPTAVANATPTSGSAPLEVNFDGTSSSDADGDTLSYEWDLDGDGAYDDSTSPSSTHTYQESGSYTASLRVSDPNGPSDTNSVIIDVGSTPPVATIEAPLPTTTWKVGDVIDFSGSATDEQDGTLPASALSWDLIMNHCPVNCHEHFLQGFEGVASGQFTTPDHEYPSHLELRLTATDSRGLTDTESVRLDPQTVQLSFQSSPSGLQLGVGPDSAATPFSRTVIVGSKNSISAPSPQTLGGATYVFSSWSDGGAQNHDITAGAQPSTYTATYNSAASQCTITGTSAGETLTGRGGNDTLDGLGGNDNVDPKEGNDTARGGAGNDTVTGNSGVDQLFGNDGDDTVNSKDGVIGNDSLDGGAHINGDTAVTDATEQSITGFP